MLFYKILANYLSNFAVFDPAVERETREKVLFENKKRKSN